MFPAQSGRAQNYAMSQIDYDHASNRHTLAGPKFALAVFLVQQHVKSVLDVGCGQGTWLKAATEVGIHDIVGIDGVSMPPARLLFPADKFLCRDLAQPWDLGRKFDLVLCLEVAEHLDPSASETLINTLTRHADHVLFSAACPGQPGQHHVNCAWPEEWQRRFNARGFVCSDSLRPQLWSDARIEPWYRQNIFEAKRDPQRAGQEPRIRSMIHPELLSLMRAAPADPAVIRDEYRRQIETGSMPISWYFLTPLRAMARKLSRSSPPTKL
jgi:SAM-dependent methyltransferase